MQIKVSIDDKEVKDLLQRLQKKTGDLTPAMRDVGEIVRRSIIRNFDEGGRPNKWPASVRVRNFGGTTLTDTARLKNSFTVRASQNSAIVGTNVWYARTHQFGGVIQAKNKQYLKFKAGDRWASKKSVTIPARPFMLVQDEDMAEIKRVINNYLTEGVK